ncbi:MAG: hypothetical protein U0V70_08410 [Terriglobia bacterium]
MNLRILTGSFLIVICMAWGGPGFAAGKSDYRALAEYYAPVIYQESHSVVLDSITRFDFDGDWNGANNWRNAYLYDLPGYVYYAVIESTQHYFITYAFYHVRDYTARPFEGFAPKTEHENDMEGCTLTIEKDGTRWGKPLLLETLAHDHFYIYDNPHSKRASPGQAPVDGAIVFLKQEDATHHRQPALAIEAEGHGVKAASEEVTAENYQHPGMIYRFAGRGAELPQSKNDPDVSYDLISIEETLWAKRNEVGGSTLYCCTDSYAVPKGESVQIGCSFNGPIGSCSAKPPWGWDQADDGPIKKGDWFRDPLFSYNQQVRIEGLRGSYLYNPYLQFVSGNGSSGPTCEESTESKTVKGAALTTLLGVAKVLLSGGLSSKTIGDQAKELFLTETVLLEWEGKTDFERWDWDKELAPASLPSFAQEKLVEEMRIPLGPSFAFSSPAFKAPSRYFDSVILKYKSNANDLQARIYWKYEDMPEFDETHSQITRLRHSDQWIRERIDLTESKNWDKGKAISKIKVEMYAASKQTVVTKDSGNSGSQQNSDSPNVLINYIILDRNSFSDTFER